MNCPYNDKNQHLKKRCTCTYKQVLKQINDYTKTCNEIIKCKQHLVKLEAKRINLTKFIRGKEYNMDNFNIKYTYRHNISELGKKLDNPCLHCNFLTDIHPDIINYCYNECPDGRRDKEDNG